ncbi:MAG: type II secretion system F family protein [bacterium]|nr:type II secretion system F family protein [bacterium]
MQLNSDVEIFDRVSYLDKLLFTKHLSLMIKSGIPIVEAIEIIGEQSSSSALKKVLHSVAQDINNGQPLYKALERNKKTFEPLYINLIKIGEESGNLEANLEHLAIQLKKNYEFNKKVQGALLYPAIIFLTALIVGSGISIFVLPKMIDIFKSLDIDLPLSTRILLWFANLMKYHGFLIVGIIFAVLILARLLITREPFKSWWDRLILNIPVFGKFRQNIELATFCRNFGIMMRSGLPIGMALQAEYDATQNTVYKKYIENMQKGVQRGLSLEQSLSKTEHKTFPLIALKMIGIGERTGKLDDTLIYLGDFFADEADNTAKNFSVILEPIILISVGLLVAFLAFSIISPIYQVTGSIKR